jgi:hypothetical protein
MLVALQLFVATLYLPPVFKEVEPSGVPPHTIISVPSQMAV